MTELLYMTDSYLREFDATVIAVRNDSVVLDRTAFYPGGGGQPHDTGVLRVGAQTYPVVRMQRREGEILHQIEGEPPTLGTRVRGIIDWERRYALMRTHTALHILCGVIFRDYGALVTGGAMQPLSARMDFELEHMTAEFSREVEEKINREIAEAREVKIRILPREEAFRIPDLIRTKINLLPPSIQEVRVVEIEGLDIQADGGTHVANTREVGYIRVVGHKSKGRINKRLKIAIE